MAYFQEQGKSTLKACWYKADILKSGDNDFLKKIAIEISNHLRSDKKPSQNDTSDILELLGILIPASKPTALWVKPLLLECYQTLKIDISKREILIAQSAERVEADTSAGFQIEVDILKDSSRGWGKALPGDIKENIVDVFTLPSEAQFDFPALTIFGHEIGHVLWKQHETTIRSVVWDSENFKDYCKTQATNWTDIKNSDDPNFERLVSYIQESFCDEIGRRLFPVAFDLALIRLLEKSLPQKNASGTHPPSYYRVKKSIDLLQTISKSQKHLKFLKKVAKNYWEIHYSETKDPWGAETVVTTIVEKIIEQLNLPKAVSTERIWEQVSSELNAFRPPLEHTRKEARPTLLKPSEIIIGTTLYYSSDNYIKKHSEYYHTGEVEKSIKRSKLSDILKEHLIYSINLYDFAKTARDTFEIELKDLKKTVWDMRDDPTAPLIIIPSIYPNIQYTQNSVDLRLGCHFLVHKLSRYTHIEPYPENNIQAFYEEVYAPPAGQFILHPHQFVLAATLEYISLPTKYYALIVGRSSWGRLGLTIATAVAVQAGYRGCLTLELRNLGETPLPLTIGTRIAQLCIIPVPEQRAGTEKHYAFGNNKYIGPTKPEIPKIGEDKDWELIDTFNAKAKGRVACQRNPVPHR